MSLMTAMGKQKTVYFAGVSGVRVVQRKEGWQVQCHPEWDNDAPDAWFDVGTPYKSEREATEQAPFIVPETHEF